MPSNDDRTIEVRTPATVGNFGPGFDTFSLAMHGLGDIVRLAPAPDDRITVEGPDAATIPTAWASNVASATIDSLRTRTGVTTRFHIHLVKGQPRGSGLGSSASSAGGAALAFHAARPDLGSTPDRLVRAAGDGEAVAAGRHHDDVAAVVLGGLAIVRETPSGPLVHRVQPPEGLHLGVVAPDLNLATKDMRALVPQAIPRADAIANLGNTAMLLEAFHAGDIATIGACLVDRIAVPHRKTKIPFYDAAVAAAVDAGAHGATLSGSGPALIAVCDSAAVASRVADAMQAAIANAGVKSRAFPARPEMEVMHDVVAMR